MSKGLPSIRAIPRSVWLVTGIFALLLLGYSVLLPTYRGPDEPQHVDLILAVRQTHSYPDFDRRSVSERIVRSEQVVRFADRSRHLRRDEAPPRDARRTLASFGLDVPSDVPNQLPQHPPLYYATMATILSGIDALVPGGPWPFDRVVVVLRLLDVALLLPLPLIGFAVVRRLGWPSEAAVAASVVPLTIPELTHIGAVVNNDDLLTLLISVLTLLIAGVITGDRSVRTACWIGVVGGLALLTKGFGLVVPVWVALAYLVPTGIPRRAAAAVRPLAVALILSTVVGGWWWIRNELVFGRIQPGIQLTPLRPGFVPHPLSWSGDFVVRMAERFWGWFGWFDVRLPLVAIAVASGAAAIGIVGAVVRGGRPWRRTSLLLLVAPAAGITLMVAAGAYDAYRRGGHGGIQGRYLFAGVLGLAAVIALGLCHVFGRRARLVAPLLLVGAIAMQLTAVRTIVRFYWGPDGSASFAERLRAMLAWSTWPTPMALAAAVALVAATIWGFVELLRVMPTDRHDESEAPASVDASASPSSAVR
jgi:hypothetical protein